jgi:hypothetical protein
MRYLNEINSVLTQYSYDAAHKTWREVVRPTNFRSLYE